MCIKRFQFQHKALVYCYLISGSFSVCIKPHVGELIKPIKMTTALFIGRRSKLRGMNEHLAVLKNPVSNFIELIHERTNLGPCDNTNDEYYR